ncbi:MAG: hypothetical protein ABSC23_20735 [Bryobacteraceae bacterium]
MRLAVLVVALAFGAIPPSGAAWAQAKTAPKDQMFSGVVTAVDENSLTAVRTGSTKETKAFTLTIETKFEGPKPRVNSRVTVRYISTDQGDRALRIIVREPAKK